MTDRATLEALLARVLEGEGWDAKLNADIAVTLGGWQRKWHDSERPHGWYWRRGDYSWTAEGEGYPADYLGSLDAVLRDLLPEGWGWAISTTGDLVPCAYGHSPDRSFWVDDTKAATPARAVCAFALRARIWIALQISGGKDEPLGN